MKFRMSIYVIMLACFSSVSPLYAQESGTSQSAQQGAAVTGQPSSVDNQGIRNYLLGPGDTLDIRFFGQSEMNTIAEVDSDGNINSLPFVETPIRARCRTEKEVQKDIAAAYSKYIKSPQISVRITERKSRQPAVVLGAVRAPARVQMQRRVRLNEIVAVSGGFTDEATGSIQVLHTEPVMCPEPGDEPEQVIASDSSLKISEYKIAELLAGKTESNPFIRPGDIVTVLAAKPIYITGSVKSPQPVYLKDGLTLSRAIAMVGGVTREAKANEIHIYRQKAGSTEQELVKVDYKAIKDKKKEDILLKPYDVIEVPENGLLSRRRIGNTLFQSILGAGSGLVGGLGQAINYKIIY